jgi:hypothetical protein
MPGVATDVAASSVSSSITVSGIAGDGAKYGLAEVVLLAMPGNTRVKKGLATTNLPIRSCHSSSSESLDGPSSAQLRLEGMLPRPPASNDGAAKNTTIKTTMQKHV